MMAINWQYQRSDEAQRMCSDYVDLGVERLAMFADRQKGKTHFCLHDLLPAMSKAGYFCVYVDFWTHKERPEQSFSEAVAVAYDQLPVLKRPLKMDGFKVSKAESGAGIKAELGLATDSPRQHSGVDEAMAWLLRMASHKPLFIVLDEVQQLAMDAAYSDFVAKLRSFLINQSKRTPKPVKALFIGSDQTRLAELFADSRAPFYGATSVSDFPDLGRPFVEFVLGCFEQATGVGDIEVGEAYRVFHEGGRLPGAYIGLLQRMASTRRFDIAKAADDFDYFVDVEALLKNRLNKLNEQDIAVLALLAQGWQSLYSQQSLRMIGSLAGKARPPSRASVQATLKKLANQSLVHTQGRGQWKIADGRLNHWLQQNTQSLSARFSRQ
ncbi:hypothetical protein GCM10011297_34380 [Bacterioplanes sanyensis]|nr:hypothetical protein GCM10011297_34380 [Bacterioplanes sanyensis]